ncbi:hypothetical protein BZG36_04801 [Bifiguratus adelaidae]|uniref:Double-strand break repair protein n=1 Tax=Bifiguratus adelaidae TaxID=1938954 RepID=A0A261XUV7_9FUNG|nr:hypothetical protein BZG36_04801 [Bifiguratus adelaidae]
MRGDESNTIKCLIATDNHVGYMEKDLVRGNDSIRTFEEILSIAKREEVDIILLAGDLFHESKPSQKSMYGVMKLLREYCYGDRPCPIELLSDQSINFPDALSTVNYQDPNINISIPIFSIHGNHDDPLTDHICALDLLSVSGLLNHFGKPREREEIDISPVLMRKGTTRMALYGIGNIRDDRLHRAFLNRKVKMLRPAEDTDDWFNIMLFHQNRVKHGKTDYIPENFLDDFLDLVIWGHEHECLIQPQESVGEGYDISQPGSSIATSLIEGEAKRKHIGILKITNKEYELETIPLRTVRPFKLEEVILSEVDGLRPSDTKGVQKYLVTQVNRLVEEAKEEWQALQREYNDNPGECPKPLIRLKVDYSGGFPTYNITQFGQQFVETVANPKNIISFHRRRAHAKDAKKPVTDISTSRLLARLPEKMDAIQIDDIVDEYLAMDNLGILPENELGDAVKLYVDKDDRDAIKEFLDSYLTKARTSLQNKQLTTDADDIMEEAGKNKLIHAQAYARDNAAGERVLMAQRKNYGDKEDDENMDDEDEVVDSRQRVSTGRGRGRGRGRGGTSSRGRGGRGGKQAAASIIDDPVELIDDDDDAGPFVATPSTPSISKRRLPIAFTSKKPAKKQATLQFY